MLSQGYPAYTTSCAWLGYSDQQLKQVSWLYNRFWSVSTQIVGSLFLFLFFL